MADSSQKASEASAEGMRVLGGHVDVLVNSAVFTRVAR